MIARERMPLARAVREDPLVEAARGVCAVLRASGYEASFVGGAVRDLVLAPERPPTDVDIATSAPPAEVLRLFPGSGFVGKSFGVSLVRSKGFAFEVATYRCEGPYGDRRHPDSVREGTQEEDSRRRDFTINALYLDPTDETVTDFHGGLEHLRRGVLACVGNARDRLYEDPLRILRLFRFAVATGFAVEESTLAAARGVREGVALLSKERVLVEIQKVKPGKARGFFASLLDVLSPAALDPALAMEPRDAPACLAFGADHPEAWDRLGGFHARFPGAALALFLRASAPGGVEPVGASANGPVAVDPEDDIIEHALEAWPLHVADRELMRVLLHLHAGGPTAGPGADGSALARATHVHRILRQVKEADLDTFLAAVRLIGSRMPSGLRADLHALERRFPSDEPLRSVPLPELFKKLPALAGAALPSRAKLAETHKAAHAPMQVLGAMHTLLEAFALLGERGPVPLTDFALATPGWDARWLEAGARIPRWRFDGLVARAEHKE